MKTDIEKRIKDNFSDVDKVKQLISDISFLQKKWIA